MTASLNLGLRKRWLGIRLLPCGFSATLLGTAAVLFSAGCIQDRPFTGEPTAADVDAASVREAGFRYRYPDEPPVLDAQGLRAFVGRFRHRVVLLDFWASWCPQNRADMAVVISLQEAIGHESLQVISCNLDDPSRWAVETVPLLNGLRASYPCVVVQSEAKAALRTWLGEDWSGDLPARFIIDPQGRVAARVLSSGSTSEVEQQVRRLVLASGLGSEAAALAPDTYALRLKLVDVRKGRAISLPEVSTAGAGHQPLAEQAYERLAVEIDRRLNARIAILPFLSVRGRSDADVLGRGTANELESAFRKHGYFDLVGPSEAERMVSQVGLTAMGIEFDPSVTQKKLACDFLVIGWVRAASEPANRKSGLVKQPTDAGMVDNLPSERTAAGEAMP